MASGHTHQGLSEQTPQIQKTHPRALINLMGELAGASLPHLPLTLPRSWQVTLEEMTGRNTRISINDVHLTYRKSHVEDSAIPDSRDLRVWV